MSKKVLAFLMVVAVAGVALGSLWLSAPGDADASRHSATRSISPMLVDPGDTVTVMFIANNYGRVGRIVDTPPGGPTQTIRLLLPGPQTGRYTFTAPSEAGSHSFSGTFSDEARESTDIVGDSMITVRSSATPEPEPEPEPMPEPQATRSLSQSSVSPGGQLTVTIVARDYGRVGRIVETLPTGLSSAGSQTVTLRLLEPGPQTVSYTVTASDTAAGRYSISGVLEDEAKEETPVGTSIVTVRVVAPEPDPEPQATRSLSQSSVSPGGQLTVTIVARDYGRVGRIVETLPTGLSSAGSQTVTLRLLEPGPQTVSYTVTASDTAAGRYSISGVLEDEAKEETPVGTSIVTVRVAAPEPQPQPQPQPQVNRAPATGFPGSSTTRSIDENSASGANVGAQVRATDADGDSLTYSLTGTDAGSFTINSSGQIMVGTGTMLDYETKASYTITVRATDPDNASDTISVTVTVGNVDEQGTVTLNPDRPLVGTALTASLTDPDGGVTGETWRWSRSDAADGTFTGIGGATRASYTPVEADEGMYLKITVTYTDDQGPNKTATAGAMVLPPSNSPPRFSETAPTRSIAENSAAGTAVGAPVRATDSDGDSLTYTLGGSDAATFSIGRTSGQLMSRAALDYETKPSYSVGVTARDNSGGSDTTTVAVAVTNVEEQGTVTLNPDRPLVGTALTASLTDPDGGVTGETWRWSRSDAADGTFTGIGGATRASYTPVEADDGMYLKITVTYTDGHGPNKTATAGAMVSDPLIARYDANKDGTIEIRELFNAIDHYFDGTIEHSRAL